MGDGYYVSMTINRKRYHGVLVSQDALKEASDIFFQHEAMSLNINKRMENLQKKNSSDDQKPLQGHHNISGDILYPYHDGNADEKRPVQKFKYCSATKTTLGYRVIVATYANIIEASNGDDDLFEKIKEACDEGGNWVGKYYYQYEVSSMMTLNHIHIKSNWDIGQ